MERNHSPAGSTRNNGVQDEPGGETFNGQLARTGTSSLTRRRSRRRSRRRLLIRALAAAVLIAALLSGAVLRYEALRVKHGMHVDEAWVYATATGHLSAFHGFGEGAGLQGHWVRAWRWKRLWTTESALDFGSVASGLAHYDVHPPLYYWLLHIWIIPFGVHLWTGPSLNLIIALFTGLALFGLARYLLSDAFAAAFVAFIWSVSPMPRLVSSMARMYELLALFCVLFVWLVLRGCDKERTLRKRDLVLLALATAGGMLTQYQFVLVVVGGALYAFWKLIRRDRRRFAALAAASLAGFAIMAVTFPSFAAQFAAEAGRHRPYSTKLLLGKINSTVELGFGFFGLAERTFQRVLNGPVHLWGLISGHGLSNLALLLAWICVVVLALALVPPVRNRFLGWLRDADKTGWVALYFFAWIAGTILAQNFSFRSPPTVMAARYLAVAWPFLAFLPVLLARALFRRHALVPVAVFCFAFLLPVTSAPVNEVASAGSLAQLSNATRVVYDAPWPGVLPNGMWYVPDNALVYADSYSDLKRNKTFIQGLDHGGFFVHLLRYPNLATDWGFKFERLAGDPEQSGGMTVYRIEGRSPSVP